MLSAEIRTTATVKIEIPVQFSRLRDMAYNLWWTWSPRARRMFKRIDAARWNRYRNPIELLIDVEPERWHHLQNDSEFIRAYRAVVQEFDAYMVPEEPTWFERVHPGYDTGPVAYFSTEFGWHESLQIYSGGLGVLAGDHSKSASDLGLPFVGIGLMYRHGYFRQTIDADGQQQHSYPDYDLFRVPLLPVVEAAGRELRVVLDFPGRDVHVRAWKASIGRVAVLLLDTDVPENHAADRPITSVLYVSGREMRLCQELVLGRGGVRVLDKLGIRPAVWHMNEGHSALLSVERLPAGASGPVGEALRELGRTAVFTTHTPVPAGNESFDTPMVRKYLAGWTERRSLDLDDLLAMGRADGTGPGDDSFNLTALALRSSARANGVSRLHGEVARGIWSPLLEQLPAHGGIGHVTNGVHLPTWLGPNMDELLRERVGAEYADLSAERFEAAVRDAPDAELWQAHQTQKKRLILLIRDRVLEQQARHGRSPDELRRLDHLLDVDALLVGFARRFATYKRADLILRDVARLQALMGAEGRPVQFVFAGKAHPADRPGQELIRRIWHASLDPAYHGRLMFLENYDMQFGRYLVQGVDVWLNSPRRPQEASGTSGMKAAMNGGLNCSILDGWWCEGYDPSHGWVIGEASGAADQESQDQLDADALYRVLGEEVAPCYYRRDDGGLPREWIARMKASIGRLAPRFSASRMVREYMRDFYAPAAGLTVEPATDRSEG